MTDASKAPRERPISPFLDVWRWHVTMLTSILHRVTGVGLYVGALILTGWAMALASGPEAYGKYMGLLGSFPGKLVMFGLTLAAFYHLANGVRHLVWDAGHGLDVKTANATAVAVIAFSVAATLAVWVFAAITGVL
jgi:succinate dehydrogenase / fumarate reductase cytochrome b subunit